MFHLIYTFSPQENLHSLTLRTGPTALTTSETHNEDRYRCEMRMKNGDSMQVTTICIYSHSTCILPRPGSLFKQNGGLYTRT